VPAVFHQADPKTGKNPPGLADNATHLDYLRHIAGVDENVVRLLEALDTLGLAEDTVVVYTSDNGYYLGEHNSGDKRSLYDESLRVPFLARYPRLFGKGTAVDEMVLNVDLAPTFLDLAGVPVPKEMQGASWKELAAGRKPAEWRQSFYGALERRHLFRREAHDGHVGKRHCRQRDECVTEEFLRRTALVGEQRGVLRVRGDPGDAEVGGGCSCCGHCSDQKSGINSSTTHARTTVSPTPVFT